mgnify:CR=1 FL=1
MNDVREKRVALVTGASSGIGASTVERLLADGWIVYGAARRLEKMEALKEKGAEILKLDVTVDESIVDAVETIMGSEGRIDALINNAGFGLYGAVEDTDLADARDQFEVNLFGLARLTQLVLPHMRSRKSGTIVNLSSMGGKVYTPLGAWYHASKYALEGWSDALRIEVAPFGIHVVIVEPGAIETEFADVMADPMMERSGSSVYSGMAKKMKQATLNTFESGKASSPDVIAKVIEEALNRKHPKTRYVAGYMARPVMFLRRMLSDRMFDWILKKGLR